MHRIHRDERLVELRAVALSLAVALGVAVGAPGASALTLNVDMGDGPLYAGTGDAPDAGTVWNLYATPGDVVALADSQGNPTSVTFQTGAESLPPYGIEVVTLSFPGAANDLLYDELAMAGGPVAWEIGGLAPGALYDLYSYGTLAPSGSIVSGPDTGGPLASFVYGVTASPAGTLSGTFCDVCNLVYTAGASGLQIQPVPEPGAAFLALAALGAGALRARPSRRGAGRGGACRGRRRGGGRRSRRG
jgi:hypothetical protein